ncbi:uncharacterized protein G2W53_025175 [Senna tora]|uniref:Uncharacterized protein n=1 Tax=Senna tora TaxID=362788 RepID=A0A834TDC5_9FABA|nr:uncharacterized protein G2W53_025175 [Senna tora]
MESTNPINLSELALFTSENYDLKLKQSIQDLLSKVRQEAPDFSMYVDTFYQLVQAQVDPPFEAIWAYVAINFRSRNFTEGDILDRISVMKELFHLLSACSASSGASKCVALLVPVVFELYKVLLELFAKELSVKREKKSMREAKSLLNSIVGYISVCCSKNFDEELDSLCPNLNIPFTDLVCLWLRANEGLESFLPLVSSDVYRWICTKVSDVGYLAGAVIMQVFFLKQCLSFYLSKSRDELEKNLKSWVVGSISSFQNIYFFGKDTHEDNLGDTFASELTVGEGIIFRISLEKPEDEILLRKVLFDAVLLVDYPFLYLNAKHIKGLTLTRLIVTHEAVEYFRGCGDQNRAISYTRAFSSSRLPLEIIKWVTNQNHLEEKASRKNGSSPGALIKWLLNLEKDKGIKVFEDDTLKSHAKLGLDISEPEHLETNLESKVADDDLFYIDNMGEEGNACEEEDEQNTLASAAFVAAAQTMKVADDGKRKHQGTSTGKKIKFVKYELRANPNPVKTRTSVAEDSSSDEREVEDPVSDSDTQPTE